LSDQRRRGELRRQRPTHYALSKVGDQEPLPPVAVTSAVRESRHTDERRAPLAPPILTPAKIAVLAE
jgi:hypothetical protein